MSFLKQLPIAFLLTACILCAGEALAASTFEIDSLGDKHHVTADRTLYHSRERVYEAFGHVVVSSRGQRLSADYLWLDENTKDIKARGNVIFVTRESTVEAAELHFNMTTGFGSIFYGKVFNDIYTLKGQLIRKVGDSRYLTTEGEYTTCKDCAESWKVAARNVDITVEGYAFMDSVFIKIKDIPTLYIPYLILPVKKERQTGLLFPRMGGSGSNGFVYVQPLFIAIDKHQDATFSFGKYSGRGLRYEGEYRYKTYGGIGGTINYNFLRDRVYQFNPDRAVLRTEHDWPFFSFLKMKWRLTEIRDRDHPVDLPEDLSVSGYPAIESNAVAQASFDEFFVSAEAKRYRNLIYDSPIGFDGGMVQALPTLHFGTRERTLLGPVMGSVYGRYDKFTRRNGPITDTNSNDIFDPTPTNPERLREAQRTIISPEISIPFRLGPYLSLAPSLQYNEVRYNFSLPTANQNLSSTSTRFLQWKVEGATTIEKIIEYDSERISKLKHQLSPFVTFSNIPWIDQDSTHLFQKQLQFSDGLFDQFDIVPMSNSTSFLRFPQGKSIYYGFTSRLIRKMKSPDEMPRFYPYDLIPQGGVKKPTPPLNRKQELAQALENRWRKYDPHYDAYQEIWNVNVSQAFDFIEAKRHREDPQRAFSYLLAKSSLNLEDLSHSMDYRYYPRLVQIDETNGTERVFKDKHFFSSSLTWTWARLMNLRGTRAFSRSMSLSFSNNSKPSASRNIGGSVSWSFNEFVNLNLAHRYDLLAERQLDWSAVTTLTHPSECWGLVLRYNWNRSHSGPPADFGFALLLNLDGSGFLGGYSFGREGGSGLPGPFGGT